CPRSARFRRSAGARSSRRAVLAGGATRPQQWRPCYERAALPTRVRRSRVPQNQTVRKRTYAIANATAIWSKRRPSCCSDVSKVVEAVEEAIWAQDPRECRSSSLRKASESRDAWCDIEFRN